MAFVPLAYDSADIGLINRKAFQQRGVLRHYGMAEGWLEPGEQAAVLSVAKQVRGAPILDIGVGGGRTAPLMNEVSSDYCGIDFAPAMVAQARRRLPGFDFREMDARYLDFHDNNFALVLFSFNGIDSVDLEGRRAIMREVHRVLRPGGYFVFSALNRNGPDWQPHWPNWEVFQGAGLRPLRLLRATAKLLRSGVNRLRALHRRRDYGEAAIGSLGAHDFALVTMFTSPMETQRQLQAAGFSVEAMFDPDGRRLSPEEARDTRSPSYNVVARKDAAAQSQPASADACHAEALGRRHVPPRHKGKARQTITRPAA